MVTLAVFAKPPLPGVVKTRLIPAIGAELAAGVYRYCLEYTLGIAADCGLRYKLYLGESSTDHLFANHDCRIQQGEDLGWRMLNAISEMLDEDTDGAIVIGSDCLDIQVKHIQQAANLLAHHELVLLPAVDGGYALIGCSRINPQLFQDVTWSDACVLEQTVRNAQSLGYRVALLETVRDIDTLQDLEHYPELLALTTPG